eukprot:11003138-Alexandrium_andersonii.AAC.1
MSASLVGSEMCIRDSGCTSELPVGWSLHAASCVSTHRHQRPTRFARPEHCLLYTSDAADDM